MENMKFKRFLLFKPKNFDEIPEKFDLFLQCGCFALIAIAILFVGLTVFAFCEAIK